MNEIAPRAVISVPANNTTMEPELNWLCRDFAPFAVSRVKLSTPTLTRDDLPLYTRDTLAALEPFLVDKPLLVVHGCTAAGFLAGREANNRVADTIRERSGARVVSTGQSMIDVLEHEGVDEIAVVTPYVESVNDGLRAYVASADIGVEVLNSFNCEDTVTLGRVTEQEVMNLALATVTSKSKALFIACSQLPTMNILAPLRQKLGIPVWSSISATAWAVDQKS